jgi:ketosteroid isomerase-like protein
MPGDQEQKRDQERQETQDEIRQIVSAINDAWTQGRPADAAGSFHAGVVNVYPGFSGREVGARAFVESYRDFARQAAIHSFSMTDMAVDIFGDTAVASYRYIIDYDMGGQTFHDVGHDLFVFKRESTGPWRVVWRTLVPQSTTQ